MTDPEPMGDDFRTAAATESESLISAFEAERGRPFDDPVEAGISYCLPIEGRGQDVMRRLKVTTVLGLVLGILGLVIAALIVIPIKTSVDDISGMRLVIALVFFALGMGLLFAGATSQGRYARRAIRDRLGDYRQTGMPEPIELGIEDSQTFTKLKLVPEDIAVVILYPDRRCAQIEGVCYRYLIYSHDVTHIEHVTMPQGQAITVEYRIGNASLGIALVPSSLKSELRRQTIGGKSGFVTSILETLSPQPNNAAGPSAQEADGN